MSGTQQDIGALPAMVTLPIARWNMVLEILGAQPWREINPLIMDMHRQLQGAVNARAGTAHDGADSPALSPVSVSNGAAHPP